MLPIEIGRVSNDTFARSTPERVDQEMSTHRQMHSDIEALDIVCQHYRTHYEQAELLRLKSMVRRLRNEIIRLQCEVGILRILLRVWLRSRANP